MGTTNNYTKHEDQMMWELHQIRKKLAKTNTISKIRADTAEIIETYGLGKKHLKRKSRKVA